MLESFNEYHILGDCDIIRTFFIIHYYPREKCGLNQLNPAIRVSVFFQSKY